MLTPQEIRALRKKLGLSARAFAERLEVSENTVWRWELGDRHPRYDMMVKLNELLDEVNAKDETTGEAVGT